MYLVLKLIHVSAVVMFLGNITTGLFWKAHGDRSGDPRIMAHTMEGVIRSDRWFTIPGVIVIVAAGVATAMIGGMPLLGTPWILWSLVLFSASGLAFVFRVAPLQVRILEIARGTPFDRDRYRAISRRWELWGFAALITPVAALVLMVLKPAP
jgi:uncharacterized membrane protein